ncbi:MAG: ATP-binding protein [Lachnospiraceae bacterium]|nr:ATP-binding protein [Lachnospiraceae bacterium]
MNKRFNVTGLCIPQKHYMVNLTERLVQVKEMVDEGAYFTIHRARQYGKTTLLYALESYLRADYLVIRIDFQKMDAVKFETGNSFALSFAACFLSELARIEEAETADLSRDNSYSLYELFENLNHICILSGRPVVLMIDEVDSASNNQVFLDFLAQLRYCYLEREARGTATFQSVILAGVYDGLKGKIRPEDAGKTNSPWNIAADFDVDMSFSQADIAGMLEEYEDDYHTGMDIAGIAALLYAYTSGYPFLVSRLCKLMDEKVAGSENLSTKWEAWTKEGFLAAVRMLLTEENTLFESMDNKLIDYPDLKQMLKELLLLGKPIENIPGNQSMRMAVMFGFAIVHNGLLCVANRIFETRLYNGFLSEESRTSEISQLALAEKSQFIRDGKLDVELLNRKFVDYYTEIFGDYGEKFLEDDGRRIFLLFVRPIINGKGNYYIEARTRNYRRTDVIIDFQGQQSVIELKIWRGNEYHSRGEEQLAEYLDYYQLKRGYMVSFNFNKKKQTGIREIVLGDKILVEAVV